MRLSNLKKYYSIFLSFGLLFFSYCSNSSKNTSNLKVFRYNECEGISSLDPAFARTTENIWVLNQLYNGLVQLDKELKVIPCIAKKWEISNDGLVYKFILRNDVFFQDNSCFPNGVGRKVTAKDFEFSFNRILDSKTASPGSWVFSNVKENGFYAANDTTLIIELIKPFSPFLNLLTHQYCSVVPVEAINFYGQTFRSNPVGTGPFKFKRWLEGEKLVLVKNKNYFESENGKKLPFIDAVAVSFIKDKQTAYLSFLKNKFDFMSGLDGSYKDDLLNYKGELNPKHSQNITMHRMPFLKTDYLGVMLNSKNNNVLQKTQLRKAISAAINRKQLISFLRNGIGIPSNGSFVPSGLPLANFKGPEHYQYNPELSKKLIKELGIVWTKQNSIVLSTTAVYADVCEFIQQQLNEVGIPCKIQVLPAAVNSESIAKGDIEFFRKSWVADFPDPENFLSVFYSHNIPPNGPNYTRFANPLYDTYYQAAIASTNEFERNNLYTKMDSIVAEECPVINLYYDEAVVFYHKNITGFEFNSLNLLQLKRIQIK